MNIIPLEKKVLFQVNMCEEPDYTPITVAIYSSLQVNGLELEGLPMIKSVADPRCYLEALAEKVNLLERVPCLWM